MCQWLQLSRLNFYRHCEGMVVTHKRVRRLMRQDNLLFLRVRKFVLTIDSNHSWGYYPNLARDLTLTAVNQLWVADITYIRLQSEFAYLAVVLDAYSRRVIGWAIDRHLRAELAITALTRALCERPIPAGLSHHSDRGVQYSCGTYVDLLKLYRVRISMSRRGNPYDNAKAESFMKTLKAEQVDGSCYATLEQARQHIAPFLDCYNRQRLHSALDYRSPDEFETACLASPQHFADGAGI